MYDESVDRTVSPVLPIEAGHAEGVQMTGHQDFLRGDVLVNGAINIAAIDIPAGKRPHDRDPLCLMQALRGDSLAVPIDAVPKSLLTIQAVQNGLQFSPPDLLAGHWIANLFPGEKGLAGAMMRLEARYRRGHFIWLTFVAHVQAGGFLVPERKAFEEEAPVRLPTDPLLHRFRRVESIIPRPQEPQRLAGSQCGAAGCESREDGEDFGCDEGLVHGSLDLAAPEGQQLRPMDSGPPRQVREVKADDALAVLRRQELCRPFSRVRRADLLLRFLRRVPQEELAKPLRHVAVTGVSGRP